jgi:hypothetical protein
VCRISRERRSSKGSYCGFGKGRNCSKLSADGVVEHLCLKIFQSSMKRLSQRLAASTCAEFRLSNARPIAADGVGRGSVEAKVAKIVGGGWDMGATS